MGFQNQATGMLIARGRIGSHLFRVRRTLSFMIWVHRARRISKWTRLLGYLVVATGWGCVVHGGERPNILWIVGENLCLDLGVYGMDNVKTPNLDGLAARGQRYTNVYSTSPVCAPSRSAFMVGMYATTTDTHHMRSHRDDDYRLPEGVRSITHRLSDVGYVTGNIKTMGGRRVGTGKLDLNFVNEGPLYHTNDWGEIQKAHRNGRPFFAMINCVENEYDIYDRQTYKYDRVPWDGEEQHPQVATPDNVTPPPYYPDHPITRDEWSRYLNSVSGMDLRIGWILEQLEEDGMTEDTIVVFFGDNGRMEPRGIHWLWDSGIHVPLIIAYPNTMEAPEGYAPGGVNDDVVSLIDLNPTTLAMAGVDKPFGMQARRFLGADRDPARRFAFSARDRIDETQLRMRSVRGARYHYIRNFSEGQGFAALNRYKEKCFRIKPLMRELLSAGKLEGAPLELMQPMPEESLYDTFADPHEIHNLAGSAEPEHQAILREMRAALDTWMVETGDRGVFPEAEDVVAPFLPEMEAWFGTPEWAK